MKKIVTLLVLIFPVVAFAEVGYGTGKITGYLPYSYGQEEMFFIKMENFTGTPACNVTYRLTMKSSNPRFKATQAAVLSAFIAGIPVRATGLGTCNNFSNSEDLKYVCLGDIPC
ncbi:MAG TPA: hypothetical protein ENI97_07385 [Gammaproteobacteria bacterium]|nr:hypothetical protein [Gammaproteobacteria bacterium]